MVFETLKKIDSIIGRINTHPEYQSCLSYRTLDHMHYNTGNHSNSLELESGELDSREIRRVREESLQNLHNARTYLESEGINLTALSKLGKIIEPNSRYGSFRGEDVKFGDFYGVSAERVPYEMDGLVLDWKMG